MFHPHFNCPHVLLCVRRRSGGGWNARAPSYVSNKEFTAREIRGRDEIICDRKEGATAYFKVRKRGFG